MITWGDGSQPAMRRPVRGHNVVFKGVSVLGPKRPGGAMTYALEAYCLTCRTAWLEDISYATKQRVIQGPNQRGTVASVVATAASRTPSCEDAYRAMVAREVLES